MLLVARDAPETAECVVEPAAETTEWVVGPTVDAADWTVEDADWTVEDAVLVTPETETVGDGTCTEGGLTDGVETEGSPEAWLAGAPDPNTAATGTVRTPTRINERARVIDGICPS